MADCQIVVLDGFEATRLIRSRDRQRHAGDADRCRAAGMDDYFSEPISVGELRRVLAPPWLDMENGMTAQRGTGERVTPIVERQLMLQSG